MRPLRGRRAVGAGTPALRTGTILFDHSVVGMLLPLVDATG